MLLPLLFGCATPNVDADYRPANDASSGAVILSMAFSGALAGYRVWYHPFPDASPKRSFFEVGESQVLTSPFHTYDFTANGKGDLIVAKLPVGDYEIDSWSLSAGAYSSRSAEPFQIRFSVRAGRAAYIGSFRFMQTGGNFMGTTSAVVSYSDMSERDLALAKKKWPNLAGTPIDLAIEAGLKVAKLGAGEKRAFNPPPIYVPVLGK